MLVERGFDAFLVKQPENVRYLSSTHLPLYPLLNRIIIPAGGDPIGLAYPIEKNRAKEHCAVKDVRFYPDVAPNSEAEDEMVKKLLMNLNAKKVFCDEEHKISGIRVKKDEFIQEMRACKQPDEIEKLKKAAELADYGAKVLVEEILREGKTEAEIAIEIDRVVRSKGAQLMSFPTIIAAGKNSAFPHHIPTNKKLLDGEFVICDFGAVYEGYSSDLTRTFAVGNVSEKLLEILDIVVEGQREAIKAIKIGQDLRLVEERCRSIFKEYGYDEYFSHCIGHGLGLGRDKPIVSMTTTDKVKKGYVFTVEPGIYISDLGGVRIEDDVYVGDQVEVLTKTPKKL
jgi:Xaa-Pro dipeptidase